jgi:hypothetical protein
MKKFWTPTELGIVRRLYPDCKTETLALILNRKASLISQKAALYGIKKSEGFKKSPISGRMMKGSEIGAATRFTKQKPGWNKGLKQVDYMSPEMIERTKATRFIKGQDPHNSVEIGFERITIDGYIEVKINRFKDGNAKNKNFVLKHRLLWESHYGPIPEGMVIRINGDKLNFTIDELEMISQRENAIRNNQCDTAIVKKYFGVKEPEAIKKIIDEMPNVIQLKRTNLILNSKINNR